MPVRNSEKELEDTYLDLIEDKNMTTEEEAVQHLFREDVDDLLKKLILKEKITLYELEDIIGEKINTVSGEITLDEYEYQIIPDINFEIKEINEYRKRISNYSKINFWQF